MEYQNLQASDYKAIRTKYENPFAMVFCPRCGNRMEYVVKSRSDKLGIIYNIECRTKHCLFYPIPPNLTPEVIKWTEPELDV